MKPAILTRKAGGYAAADLDETLRRRAAVREEAARAVAAADVARRGRAGAAGADAARGAAADSWSAVRKRLRAWEPAQLLGLIHDLFEALPEARATIAGRLGAGRPVAGRARALEGLRRKVRRAVRPSRQMWNDEPRLPEARRVADQYYRTTRDADGAVDLFVELLDAAMQLSFEFGWDDSGFYDSLARAACAAEKLLPGASDAARLGELEVRLRRLLTNENFPGWGMEEVIEDLADAIGKRVAAINRPPPEDEFDRVGRERAGKRSRDHS